MLTFFRRIRKGLLNGNRTSRYLLYAIGEIALVVIGILIALQINNWNENRKLQNEELDLLADIRTNLISNHNSFKNDSLANVGYLLQYEKIGHYIENDLKYDVELDSAFGVLTFWRVPYITSTAYNSLQTKGLHLVKNEDLRNQIVKIYEVDLKALIDNYDKSEWDISLVVTPFFSKHIRRLHEKSLSLSRPNDFETLKHNAEFQNLLSMIIRQRKRGQEFFGSAMSKMKSLINAIELEIDSR